MRKSKVIKLIEDTFCICHKCGAVLMKDNIKMHEDWHFTTRKRPR